MQARDIPTRIVAQVSEITVEAFLQHRSLGHGADFGERVGAAIFFTRSETLSIALAEVLASAGVLGLRGAYELVTNPPQAIVDALAGQGDGPLTFWPSRGADSGNDLARAMKIVIDAAALVRGAAGRLDIALETDRRRAPRRLSFDLPSAGTRRA